MGAELDYYKVHTEQAKHLEVQRSTVAGIAAALAAAIVGDLLKKDTLTRADLPATVTLCMVGLYALVFCAKFFERMKLHQEIARLARNKLDPTLNSIRINAEKIHRKKFPLMYPLGLHILWNSFFGCISLLGLGFSLRILYW